jgi:hypothetical protein
MKCFLSRNLLGHVEFLFSNVVSLILQSHGMPHFSLGNGKRTPHRTGSHHTNSEAFFVWQYSGNQLGFAGPGIYQTQGHLSDKGMIQTGLIAGTARIDRFGAFRGSIFK